MGSCCFNRCCVNRQTETTVCTGESIIEHPLQDISDTPWHFHGRAQQGFLAPACRGLFQQVHNFTNEQTFHSAAFCAALRDRHVSRHAVTCCASQLPQFPVISSKQQSYTNHSTSLNHCLSLRVAAAWRPHPTAAATPLAGMLPPGRLLCWLQWAPHPLSATRWGLGQS